VNNNVGKQKRETFLFPFVTSRVEKSNFYEDLEGVTTFDFKQIDTKNKTTSIPYFNE
jgi:hypothetical protein